MAEEFKSEEILNDTPAKQEIDAENEKQIESQEDSNDVVNGQETTSEAVLGNASNEQEINQEDNKPKKIENLEKALKIFKRKSAGIISEVRKREAYDSPSVKRKKKSKEARRKNKKNYRFGNNY